MRGSFFSCLTFLLLLSPEGLESRVIQVPGEVATIQVGIDLAQDGDTVRISPGRYAESEIDFRGKAIRVTGTNPEDLDVVTATIIDTNLSGRAFDFHSGEDTTSVLAGVTIAGCFTGYWGGGIRCSGSSPKIEYVVVAGNGAANGGGGIMCEDASPKITNSVIIADSASAMGGGGIRCSNASPTITRNIIGGNSAEYGGGVDCHYSSSPTISNNVIAENRAWSGGGIYCYNYASPMIANNAITGNSADNFGGGIRSKGYSSPRIVDSVLWGNGGFLGEEIYIGGGSEPSSLTIRYSDVEGGLSSVFLEPGCTINWGGGMIDADPMFVDGIYHLGSGSPCADRGDPSMEDACRPPGLRGIRGDMGAFGGEGNCWWPQNGFYISFFPTGDRAIPQGGTLFCRVYLYNISRYDATGELWFSVLLPDSQELLIPPRFLNCENPLSGAISPFGAERMSIELSIPMAAETGHYTLIGRAGSYPDQVADEELILFEVVDGKGPSRILPDPDFLSLVGR